MAHDRAIMSFNHERRHAAEYDQNPNRKASVPKECVDHECDSFLKELIMGLGRNVFETVSFDPGSGRGGAG